MDWDEFFERWQFEVCFAALIVLVQPFVFWFAFEAGVL